MSVVLVGLGPPLISQELSYRKPQLLYNFYLEMQQFVGDSLTQKKGINQRGMTATLPDQPYSPLL